MGISVNFTNHARERLKQRKGVEASKPVVSAIQKAIAKDTETWPENVECAWLDVYVGEFGMQLRVVKCKPGERYNYAIVTVMFIGSVHPNTAKKKAKRKRRDLQHEQFVQNYSNMQKRKSKEK